MDYYSTWSLSRLRNRCLRDKLCPLSSSVCCKTSKKETENPKSIDGHFKDQSDDASFSAINSCQLFLSRLFICRLKMIRTMLETWIRVYYLHHFRFWLAQFLAAGRRAELEQIMPRHESTRTELHPVVTTNKDEYALGIRSVCIHSENPFSENCAFESNLFATNCIMPFPFVWCKIFGSDTKW